MIENAKRISLEEVEKIAPDEMRIESSSTRTKYVDPDKEMNCDIAEREVMRKARLAKFKKN